MSARLNLLILLLPFYMSGQVQFLDDFTDGDYTANPPWKIDTGLFVVTPDKRLQLKDTIAGEAQIYTPSIISHEAEWNFAVELDFNPSGSNYAEVYLCADSSDFLHAPNAVFVRIGGSTADKLSLFVRQAGKDTTLLESTSGWVGESKNRLKIQLKRSAGNLWELLADSSAAFAGFTSLGTATYNPLLYSKYTGMRCIYTVTRAEKMFFDDFAYTGTFVSDTIPPRVKALILESTTELRLQFDEPLNATSAQNPAHYEIFNEGNQIIDAELDSESKQEVLIEISPALEARKNYHLQIQAVEDKEGNPLRDTTLVFTHFTPQRGDLVFNELLPDPTPVIGIFPDVLPEGEYMELYNPQAFDINLTDWKLSVGSKEIVLGDKLVPADSFVVIARADVQLDLPAETNFLAVPLSKTALTNGGALLRLLSPDGLPIDEVAYDESWYGDLYKAEGGWSLERIDATNFCGGAENWKACIDPMGGSPGRRNSVDGQTSDTTSPKVSRFSVSGDSLVYVHLSEWVDDPLLLDIFAYTITPVLNLKSIRANRLAGRLEFVLADYMEQGEVYTLAYLGSSADCAGNPLLFGPGLFGRAQPAQKGGLILNEVLFNPHSGGADYVELYNTSDELVDLEKLRLSSYLPGTNILDEVTQITTESYLLAPGDYVCLTEHRAGVSAFYTMKAPEALFEAKDLPSLPDDAGSIVLLNANLTVVDSFVYSDALHSPALLDDEGVSLECTSNTQGSGFANLWYSATATAGFGTPGYANSQQKSMLSKPKLKLDIKHKVFSPNNDGYRDKLEIGYLFDNTNYVVSLTIYSKTGYEIKKLINAQTLAAEGMLVWDGTDTQGEMLKRDAYVVVLEYFHSDGESGLEKQAAVLTY